MKRSTPSNLDLISSSAKRERGFTLLELLIALAMVALISLSLFTSLRTAIRAKTSAEDAVAPGRTIELAMDLIRADIENVIPPNANSVNATSSTSLATADGTTALYIAGPFVGLDQKDDRGHEGDDLVLYSTTDGPSHESGDGDIRRIELMVIPGNNTNEHVLIRRLTANILAPQLPQPDDEVICRGVSAFNLRYFDGVDWQDSWDSTIDNNELPVAVEVTLDLDRRNSDGTVDPNAPPRRFVRIFSISTSTVTTDSTTTDTTTGGN